LAEEETEVGEPGRTEEALPRPGREDDLERPKDHAEEEEADPGVGNGHEHVHGNGPASEITGCREKFGKGRQAWRLACRHWEGRSAEPWTWTRPCRQAVAASRRRSLPNRRARPESYRHPGCSRHPQALRRRAGAR